MSAAILQPDTFITSLMQPELYDPTVKHCRLIETHISWIILAGPFAYKIKKALNLGFLDFSTLEKRRFYCEEELRLNKRLAPEIYLSVVPITGTPESPSWAGGGKAIEYALKMRAFPQQAQLDRALAQGNLQPEQIDILAQHIADFHQRIGVAAANTRYGTPEVLRQPVEENFLQIRQHTENSKTLEDLRKVEDWSRVSFEALEQDFIQRKKAGFVRECHGDLHLQNIAWMDDGPLLFDCIEFSPNLRWIDVMSDVAFLVMDLLDRRQSILSRRFLNSYLEQTGDYAGLRLLSYYLVYRAMVRAKIDAIRVRQEGITPEERAAAEKDFMGYLNLALAARLPATPWLIITRGLSGSGKSTLTQALLEQVGGIRIRSDVERKRLYGLWPENDGLSGAGTTLYSSAANEATYHKLQELAGIILDSGYSVFVDAVFMDYEERQQFQQLASSRQLPFILLDCVVEEQILRSRIVLRRDDVSDADLNVLEMQLAKWQPLRPEEHGFAITVDTGAAVAINTLAAQIRAIACPSGC